ncbi:META domain-containing protein [Thaumasiovibrio subtropicus]|uniref:META domain-containing protein n=1 Tax=Thaumasiovibrio subtropicus TaxID=1891207 RepID=UPI000B35F1D3|nr:META domain-containing protein [Thaumasiovibrio subtropicus]
MTLKYWLVGLGLLSMVGCGSTSGQSTQEITMVTAADLLHHNWQLLSIDGAPVTADHKLNTPRLEVGEALNSNGYAGCNTYMGKAELNDSQFRIEQMIMTMKACSEQSMATEAAFTNTLNEWSEISIEGDLLIIEGVHKLVLQLDDWKY